MQEILDNLPKPLVFKPNIDIWTDYFLDSNKHITLSRDIVYDWISAIAIYYIGDKRQLHETIDRLQNENIELANKLFLNNLLQENIEPLSESDIEKYETEINNYDNGMMKPSNFVNEFNIEKELNDETT